MQTVRDLYHTPDQTVVYCEPNDVMYYVIIHTMLLLTLLLCGP